MEALGIDYVVDKDIGATPRIEQSSTFSAVANVMDPSINCVIVGLQPRYNLASIMMAANYARRPGAVFIVSSQSL